MDGGAGEGAFGGGGAYEPQFFLIRSPFCICAVYQQSRYLGVSGSTFCTSFAVFFHAGYDFGNCPGSGESTAKEGASAVGTFKWG